MPRELVHWIVCEDGLRQLAGKVPRIQAVTRQHRQLFLLGAIAHDAPYYLQLGRGSFHRVADRLHGAHGADPYQPIRELIEGTHRMGIDAPWAFVAGLISHIVTDAVFHPLIFFYSGDYHATDPRRRFHARRRHRLMEVYIDSWARHRGDIKPRETIQTLLSSTGETLRSVFSLLSELPSLRESWDEGRADLAWSSALHTMGRLERVFGSAALGMITRVLTRWLPLGEFDALFSFRRKTAPEFFSARIEYRNPVTGSPQAATLDELLESAISKYKQLLNSLEQCMGDRGAVFADSEPGPSLDSGIVGSTWSDLRFFSDERPKFLNGPHRGVSKNESPR